MDDEIQLISDGDGLAVVGNLEAVGRFLASEGLPSKNFGLPGLVGPQEGLRRTGRQRQRGTVKQHEGAPGGLKLVW